MTHIPLLDDAAVSAPCPPQRRELPTVLIVDDERINRQMLAELLKDECRVVLAKDGVTALQRIATEPVSLVLLDATMPSMDGYEVLQRLRANPASAELAVIFVTGQTSEASEERALRMGATDYIVKPVRPWVVRARVRHHLALARQRAALAPLTLEDDLTGVANRRCLEQCLTLTDDVDLLPAGVLGLALVDVDALGLYNQHYGHGAGDDVLRQVARVLLRRVQSPHERVARVEGTTFAWLLPGVTDLMAVLEPVRAAVQALAIAHAYSPVAPVVTVSAGGVVLQPPMPLVPSSLPALAWAALHQAKAAGRNAIVLHSC